MLRLCPVEAEFQEITDRQPYGYVLVVKGSEQKPTELRYST